jgi:hypothetical protein
VFVEKTTNLLGNKLFQNKVDIFELYNIFAKSFDSREDLILPKLKKEDIVFIDHLKEFRNLKNLGFIILFFICCFKEKYYF